MRSTIWSASTSSSVDGNDESRRSQHDSQRGVRHRDNRPQGFDGQDLRRSFLDGETGEVTTFRADEKPWRGRSKIDDSKLAVAIREHLERYKLIAGHNSKLFDIPFINARLAKHGERPVNVEWHMDTRWFLNSASMRIGSAKLENVRSSSNWASRRQRSVGSSGN